MVAQYERDIVAVGIEPPQGADVVWTPIYQIAHAPEPILIGVEFDLLEEALKRLETALNVADDVGAHSGGA